jgi:predicted dehydrogenase
VVCEKPMALSVSDCEKVLSASQTFQRHFFCVTQNRYSPPAQWLHEIISSNKLGKIYIVQVTGFWNRDDRYYKNSWKGTKGLDGGTLFTQFSHFVDTLHWLFGQIQITGATLKNFNHTSIEFEDTGLFTFSLPYGGIGSFSYSTSIWDKNMESTITIIGENGTVKVGGQYMEDVVYCHIKDYQFEPPKLSEVPVAFGNYSGSAANHYLLINDVIKALKGLPTQLASTGECVSVVKTISDVYSFK